MSRATWTPAYVAIGANVDEPLERVKDSFGRLELLDRTRLIARSRLYRTTPLGPQDQPDFINAAAGLLTQLTAVELLTALKRLEQVFGRDTPAIRWGPRRIDFDLIVFGEQRIDTEQLQVPHPGVSMRNFVLYPLRDVAPALFVPGHGRIEELAQRVSTVGLSALA